MACFSLGCACGSLLGGVVGDGLSKRYGSCGRVLAAQISVALSLPAAALLVKGLPLPGGAYGLHTLGPMYGAAFFAAGAVVSWCGTNNSAIFSEIVPERLRSSIYAFDRSFEGALAAPAAPLVGLLTQKAFGFVGTLRHDPLTPPDVVASNARALGSAMLVLLIVPWALCGIFYFGLYYTLPRDKVASAVLGARLDAEAAAAAAERGVVVGGQEGSVKGGAAAVA